VVIDDLDVVCVPVSPDEANPELIVDADAMLAFLLPLNASRRLPGGTAKSCSCVARRKIMSFFSAEERRLAGMRRLLPVSHNNSVSASAKLLITFAY
jgi:hypothetical protein